MHAFRVIACAAVAVLLVGCGGTETEPEAEPEAEVESPAAEGLARCVPEEPQGAALFAEVGCLGCHTYDGDGSQNLDAPDLTSIGETDRGAEWYADHLRDAPGDHPSFATLGDEQLLAIGRFLDASRGC